MRMADLTIVYRTLSYAYCNSWNVVQVIRRRPYNIANTNKCELYSFAREIIKKHLKREVELYVDTLLMMAELYPFNVCVLRW